MVAALRYQHKWVRRGAGARQWWRRWKKAVGNTGSTTFAVLLSVPARYRPCILINPLLKTLANVNGPFMFTNCVPGQHVYRLNRRCRNAASWFWDPSLLLVWDILTGGAKSF